MCYFAIFELPLCQLLWYVSIGIGNYYQHPLGHSDVYSMSIVMYEILNKYIHMDNKWVLPVVMEMADISQERYGDGSW